MTEGLAGADGHANARHQRIYRAWADGGIGLSMTGNVMIDRRYLERPGNVAIDGDGGIEPLREWAAAGGANGTALWMQISHPGRQCSRAVTSRPVAPSAVPLRLLGYFAKPRALREEEIEAAIGGYARVAGIARASGFGGVQIHAAHGYLINQFLSPLTNLRNDRWGGGLAHRARFLRRVVAAVRAAVGPQFPIGVKLNSADFQKGGFTPEESRQVAAWLEEDRIDLLEVSGGTYENPRLLGLGEGEKEPQRKSTRQREAYFLDYARAIRESVSLPLAVTGGFRSAAAMAEAIDCGAADVVGIARPLCVEPDLPRRLLDGTATAAPRYEDRARLGERGLMSPASPIGSIRALNAQAAAAWFYRQIILLADGKPVHPDLGAGRAVMQHLRDETRLAFARRAWLRQSEKGDV